MSTVILPALVLMFLAECFYLINKNNASFVSCCKMQYQDLEKVLVQDSQQLTVWQFQREVLANSEQVLNHYNSDL